MSISGGVVELSSVAIKCELEYCPVTYFSDQLELITEVLEFLFCILLVRQWVRSMSAGMEEAAKDQELTIGPRVTSELRSGMT